MKKLYRKFNAILTNLGEILRKLGKHFDVTFRKKFGVISVKFYRKLKFSGNLEKISLKVLNRFEEILKEIWRNVLELLKIVGIVNFGIM